MRHLKFLFLIAVLGMCFSCTKENGIYDKNAVLTWSNPALDGCGFSIKINGKIHKPVNEQVIDASYREEQDKVRVEIEYKLLEKNAEFYCGMSNTPINVGTIEIISIKRK